jgi:hypothetical protein
MEIKIGDKVKIPKSKKGCIYGDYGIYSSQAIRNAKTLKQDFLFYNGLSRRMNEHLLHHSYDPNNLTGDYFDITEIELYEEELIKESKENLLETEFVIENCTLSQRLAIKAYCDEKKIKYYKDLIESTLPSVYHDKVFESCTKTFSTYKTKVTFSELIQFLDKYQPEPEPEFKVGDVVAVLDTFNVRNYDSRGIGHVFEIRKDGTYFENFLKGEKEAIDLNNKYCTNYQLSDLRHATPEEIKKWKEENEIKLPTIDGHKGGMTAYVRPNDTLSWGCTSISVRTVKELLKMNLKEITLGSYNIDNLQIQQIKKFIEYNKL